MTEEEKDIRIKELEDFIKDNIIDTLYYYHSPLWHRAMEILNLKDEDE